MSGAKLSAAALILLGAFFARWFGAVDARALDSGPYAALDDGERAARLRAIELTLATGRVPERDRALEFPDGAPLAWPPLVHGALARAARLAADERGAPELGGVGEAALERIALPLAPLAGLLATVLAFACGASRARGASRFAPACAAAAAYAFAPAAVARETAGSLASQPWIAVLSFAQIAALGFRFRAAQRVDTVLGALLGGVAAGFALLAGAEAWPVPGAALAVSVAVSIGKPRDEQRDAWRAVMAFAAVALAVVALGEPGEALARVVPAFADTARSRGLLSAPLPLAASVLASAAIAGAALGSLRRSPERALSAGVAFLSLACALFDGRFLATWNVALAMLAAAAAADHGTARPRKLVASLAAVAAIAFAAPYAAAIGRSDRAGEQRAQVERGLAWMRAGTASPGSFNHPGAELDWCVLAPAELGPLVAYHARRPAALAALGARTPAREAELAAILAASDDRAFVRWLDRERARFVVAVPQLVRDARLGGGGSSDPRSLAARLALPRSPSGEAAVEGLALAYAAPDWRTPDGRAAEPAPGAGPSITIWRRTDPSSAGLEVEVGPVR